MKMIQLSSWHLELAMLYVNKYNNVCVCIRDAVIVVTYNMSLGLSLLCSENFLLCFLALLQFCAYYARFYATPQSIMLLIIKT